MSQLKDKDIVERILKKELVEMGLPDPYATETTDNERWYLKESPVQAASLDLHIGGLFVPGESKKRGSDPRSREHYSLAQGQTVIASSKETLRLPSDISAFGFPPDKLSQNGILMVNLGHIDPGWHGPLKFVLVNFGKEPYPLKKGDIVGTLLFYKLDGDVNKNISQRDGHVNEKQALQKINSLSNSLSKDFLNVNKRAKNIILKSIGWGSLITVVIGAILSFFDYSRKKEIDDIKTQMIILQKDNEYAKMKPELDSLKQKVGQLIANKQQKTDENTHSEPAKIQPK